MAIYYLNVKTIGRGAGGKATSAAAYRAGERIRDERTGRAFDHSRRTDVMSKEIVLPSTLAALDMSWARDRSSLWNAAELAERRGNARVAREYLVALPHELTPAQRLGLVHRFSQELADQHGFAVDLAIHAPRPHNDPRSYHAHLLTTTREVLPKGLGLKTALDLSGSERRARGLGSWLDEILTVRERWASLTNEALLQADVQARIDHRSLAAQGIDREPLPRIPMGAWHAEAGGHHSEIADRIRAAYRARVEARLARTVARPLDTHGGGNLEDIRRYARQSWLRLRQTETEKATEAASG
jgi:ATP-dependent exoDNAse (exonuclease V) alpha subunit